MNLHIPAYYRYMHPPMHMFTCTSFIHSCTLYIQMYSHIPNHITHNTDKMHIQRQTNIVLFLHSITHAFIALAVVWQFCEHQRLAEEEDSGEEEACVMPSGYWLLPYQRRRAEVRDWLEEESQADYKSLVSSSFLFSWAVSAVSPSLYLVFPAIWPLKQLTALCLEDGGRVERWAVRGTCGQVGPFSPLSHLFISVPQLSASCGFISVWVTPGKARETWAESLPSPSFIPPVRVDDLCSSVSRSASAPSTLIFH